MNDFNVNPGSWHFRLNRFMVAGEKSISDEVAAQQIMAERKDFCSYWRLTMFTMARAFAVVVFVIGFVFAVIFLVALPFRVEWDLVGFIAGIIRFVVMAVIFAVVLYINEYLKKRFTNVFARRKTSDVEEKQPGLLKMKYMAWKGKYCPMVTYNGR